jgi:hypothetical protein
MRALTITLGLVAAAFAADMQASRAVAYPIYPWCAFYNVVGGASNCTFTSWQQCQQTIPGMGGYCYENPFSWAQGPGSERPRTAAPKKGKRRTTQGR